MEGVIAVGVSNECATIVANERVADGLFVMTVQAPDLAAQVQPGQFAHVRIPGMDDHILRRPFSIYASDAGAGTVDILYQVVGFGTAHLAKLERGAKLDAIGPVGFGWSIPDGAASALVVAGGVGAAPLFMLTQRLAVQGVDTIAVLGAQTADSLVCRARYESVLGADRVRCSTDDGSLGFHGFATPVAERVLAERSCDIVYTCGPEPLMRGVAAAAAAAGSACQVSLERRMACGIGACLSCVVETTGGKKRACVDGPVFDADEVVW